MDIGAADDGMSGDHLLSFSIFAASGRQAAWTLKRREVVRSPPLRLIAVLRSMERPRSDGAFYLGSSVGGLGFDTISDADAQCAFPTLADIAQSDFVELRDA